VNVKFVYLGRSRLAESDVGPLLSLSPNLAREPVAFDAALQQPLRFREAISSLHDVVISDLRFRRRDKTAYLEWKKGQARRASELRQGAHAQAKAEILAQRQEPVPKDLEKSYHRCLRQYWSARQKYASYLMAHDLALWRKLMPCDPVITVADDVVFFECFSADESSYGCLLVDRERGFGRCDNLRLGTTNVDYSWDLYHHFQSLRSYRPTRFRLDSGGFDVATQGSRDYREEKIDLPAGWLRGFMQIQSAMTLPALSVSLSREAVYSILVWLKRHRAWTSPRALRFELLAGQSPRLVLEPWEQPIVSYGTRFNGPETAPIRIWGTRRLLVLARTLPLAERFDVYLLGTGLPSFWVVHMGDMRLVLGLSGWTANDWTRGSALDLLCPPIRATDNVVGQVAQLMQERRVAKLDELQRQVAEPADVVHAALRHLAHAGQVIADLTLGAFRWRQIMPQALGEAEFGPPNSELVAAGPLLSGRRATVTSRETVPCVGTLLTGTTDNAKVELLIDPDGRIRRGKCVCTHFRRYGLRNGPCRHMLALRWLEPLSAEQLVVPYGIR